MLSDQITNLVTTIETNNTVFGDRGSWRRPKVEGEQTGLTDRKENYFFIEIIETDNGNEYTVTPIDGSWMHNVSASVKFVASVKKTNREKIVRNILIRYTTRVRITA